MDLKTFEGMLKAATVRRMDRKMRLSINTKLVAAGMGGSTRFQEASKALAEALAILSDFGIEEDGLIFESHKLHREDSGQIAIDLAWSNQADPFSPETIPNSKLALQWTKLETGYEVIAYLS